MSKLSARKKPIIEKLKHKENWTPELRYVHRSRLIFGFTLGIIFGLGLRGLL